MPTRKILLLLALVFLPGCPGNLEPLTQFQNRSDGVSFTTYDVFGQQVTVGEPSPNVTIVFFNGKANSDNMQPVTGDIAVHFYEARDIDFVNILDIRTLAFYERPFAAGAIQDAAPRTVRRVNRRLVNEGLPEIEVLDEHLFLIADDEGRITERFGVPNPDRQITAVVYDRDGAEVGRFNPEAEMDTLLLAVEAARAGSGVIIEESDDASEADTAVTDSE